MIASGLGPARFGVILISGQKDAHEQGYNALAAIARGVAPGKNSRTGTPKPSKAGTPQPTSAATDAPKQANGHANGHANGDAKPTTE